MADAEAPPAEAPAEAPAAAAEGKGSEDVGGGGGAAPAAPAAGSGGGGKVSSIGLQLPDIVPSKYAEAKAAILATINEERAAAGVEPLELDDRVGSTADAFCASMIANGFTSHYDENGHKPYQRYFFGGTTDHVVENVAGFTAKEGKEFDDSVDAVRQQMSDAHAEFMAVEGPSDVQKQNVLDKVHTHVGIGVAVTGQEFRYVEVFLDRYVQVCETEPGGEHAPQLSLTSDETYVVVKSLRPDMDVVGCTVYYEPKPSPMSADVLNAQEGYEDYTAEKASVVWPWEMIRLADKSLRVPIFLSQLRYGHYYVQVYVRADPESIPYDAPSEDLDITSPDVVTATGIVLTCSKSQVTAFEDSRKGVARAAEGGGPGGHAAKGEGEDAAVVAAPGAPLSDVTVTMGLSAGGPPGFRPQQAGSSSSAAMASEDSPVVWMRSEPGSVIVEAKLAPSDSEAPAAPEGMEALSANLVPASAAILGGEGSSFVFLAVRREASGEGKDEEGKEGAPEGALRDMAVAYVPADAEPIEVPAGYAAASAACVGGRIMLLTTTDEAAAVAVAESAAAKAAAMEELGGEAAAEALGVGEEEDAEAFEVAPVGDEALEGGYEEGMDWRDADEDEADAADGADDYEDPEAEAERRRAERDRVYQLLQEARAERERLNSLNLAHQRRLAIYFASRKPDEEKEAEAKAAGGAGAATGAPQPDAEKEKRYQETLANVNKARGDLEATRSSFDAIAMDLQSRLDEKEAKASEIQDAFVEFKREIAKAAENSRTGKPIPRRIIRQFEATEAAKDTELEKVRLKNIHLRTQLRKLETRLKEKEQLADGLHLIDFEQLKIENQTLNEKIEERNEELHKLRKKTTTTVQVLTHIKEKLQHVQAEAGVLKKELAELESQVTSERDALAKAKHERDDLRAENDRVKQQQGFVNSTLLVKDFRTRKADMKALERELEELRQRYSFLTAQAGGATMGSTGPV